MHNTPKKRRSKYLPVADYRALPKLRLTNAHLKIIDEIHNQRYTTTNYLAHALNCQPNTLKYGLRQLWDYQFVHRLFLPHPKQYGGSSAPVYIIGNRARNPLAQYRHQPLDEIEKSPKDNAHVESELLHHLLISSVHSSLRRGARETGKQFLFFENERSRSYRFKEDIRRYVSIKPDGFAGIQDPLKPENCRDKFFFFEADASGKLTVKNRMYKRFRRYWRMWRLLRHEGVLQASNFEWFPPLTNFRVLIVVAGKEGSERMENLIKLCFAVDERRQGSKMFCFTTTDKFPIIYREGKTLVSDATAVFQNIWRIGLRGDQSLHSLFE